MLGALQTQCIRSGRSPQIRLEMEARAKAELVLRVAALDIESTQVFGIDRNVVVDRVFESTTGEEIAFACTGKLHAVACRGVGKQGVGHEHAAAAGHLPVGGV